MFVVATVLRHLEAHWNVPDMGDQAWMTASAFADMERRFRQPLLDYLDRAQDPLLDYQEESRLLNGIVQTLIQWTAEGPNPRQI